MPDQSTTATSNKPPSTPTKIVLPDLVSHCAFNVRVNRFRKQASAESKKWLFRGDNLNGKKRDAYHGLKAGLLTSMCYPDAGCPQLRVCCDFMNYLFHLDNLSDDMDIRGTRNVADAVLNSLYHPYTFQSSARVSKMTKDYWKRMIPTASKGTQQRFIETFDFFFQAVSQQALDRDQRSIPDLESYIALRRDTSGCKPCWALIEYANNLNIPDEVMEHPAIRALGEAANDLVTWSNDLFSYNVEQSKGDTHNMIPVIMHQDGLGLQAAVDFVGDLCKQSIDRFIRERSNLPSWGPDIDREVNIYVDGLANWICGSLHWSFESERYFGKDGLTVKATRVVHLLPRRAQALPPVTVFTPPSTVDDTAKLSSVTESIKRPAYIQEETLTKQLPQANVAVEPNMEPIIQPAVEPSAPFPAALPPTPSIVITTTTHSSSTLSPALLSPPRAIPTSFIPSRCPHAHSLAYLFAFIFAAFQLLARTFTAVLQTSYDVPTLILIFIFVLSRCLHAFRDMLFSLTTPTDIGFTPSDIMRFGQNI